jgi:RHS repeat-associated protein
VFFDNLAVQYKQGPLLEENHYYPFGLTMAGISDKAVKTNYAQNKYRFNFGSELQNQEFSDGSGLETYDATYRMYDPQIGRFWQQDPLGELAEGWSPYAFVLDNPISLVDPLGDTATLPSVTVTPPPAPKRDNNLPGLALIGTPPGGVDVPSAPTNAPDIPTTYPGTETTPGGEPDPVLPGLSPLAGALTLVGVLIPEGGPSFPNNDEMFYHKYPQFKPENLPRGVQNKPIDDIYLVRFGPGPESTEELAADAKKATYFGLPHGVSTAIRPKPPTFGRAAKVLDVMKHFLVLKTGERPDHFTVVLPNPVTQQVADEFNALFTPK